MYNKKEGVSLGAECFCVFVLCLLKVKVNSKKSEKSTIYS